MKDASAQQDSSAVRTISIASLAVFLILAFFIKPSPFWLDAPEFMAASWQFGQVHPPGHPVAMPLIKGFMLMPFGNIAFRANLFSAFFGAVSSLVVGLMVFSIVRRTYQSISTQLSMAIGVAGTVAFGLCTSSVIQSMSVEIYSLNAALVLLASLFAMKAGSDARIAGLVGILIGLGLGNHHFLTILAIPGVVLLSFDANGFEESIKRIWPGVALAVAVTIGVYAYLPARSAGWPTWTDASSLSGVIWIASAKIFAGSVGGFENTGLGLFDNASMALQIVIDNISWVGLVLAVMGLVYLAAKRRFYLAAGLALLVLGSLASKVVMGLLDPSNPDDHGYFAVAIATMVVLEGIGLAGILETLKLRLVSIVSVFAMMVLPLPIGLFTLSQRANAVETSEVMEMVWQSAPPGSVALVSHYPIYFMTLYDQGIEGVRPDVTVVQQSFYSKAQKGTFYAQQIAIRDDDLGPLVRSFLESGELNWPLLLKLAKVRPVLLEADSELVVPYSDLVPNGWFFRIQNEPMQPTNPDDFLEELKQKIPGWPTLATETRRVIVRLLAASSSWLKSSGHLQAASNRIEAALELNPVDAAVLAIKKDLESQLPQ